MESRKLNRTIDFKLPTAILGASLASDERSLVAACMDGVYIAELEAKSFERIGGHDSYVSSTVYLGDQNRIVTAGYDGVVQWFDRETKQLQHKLKAHEFWSWDMAVSPDQKLIATVTCQYLAGGYKYEPALEREALRAGESLRVIAISAVSLQCDSRPMIYRCFFAAWATCVIRWLETVASFGKSGHGRTRRPRSWTKHMRVNRAKG